MSWARLPSTKQPLKCGANLLTETSFSMVHFHILVSQPHPFPNISGRFGNNCGHQDFGGSLLDALWESMLLRLQYTPIPQTPFGLPMEWTTRAHFHVPKCPKATKFFGSHLGHLHFGGSPCDHLWEQDHANHGTLPSFLWTNIFIYQSRNQGRKERARPQERATQRTQNEWSTLPFYYPQLPMEIDPKPLVSSPFFLISFKIYKKHCCFWRFSNVAAQ